MKCKNKSEPTQILLTSWFSITLRKYKFVSNQRRIKLIKYLYKLLQMLVKA